MKFWKKTKKKMNCGIYFLDFFLLLYIICSCKMIIRYHVEIIKECGEWLRHNTKQCNFVVGFIVVAYDCWMVPLYSIEEMLYLKKMVKKWKIFERGNPLPIFDIFSQNLSLLELLTLLQYIKKYPNTYVHPASHLFTSLQPHNQLFKMLSHSLHNWHKLRNIDDFIFCTFQDHILFFNKFSLFAVYFYINTIINFFFSYFLS